MDEIKLAFHLHPDISIIQVDEHTFELIISNQTPITCEMEGYLDVRIEDTTYHPEFGLTFGEQKPGRHSSEYATSEVRQPFYLAG